MDMKSHSEMKSIESYSTLAIFLHWMLAALIAFQIGIGWRMEELSLDQGLFSVTQLHKSIGIVILLLSILRLVVRYFKPKPVGFDDQKWARNLSNIVHIILYIFMIGAPITGWFIVSTSQLNIDTYIFDTLFWPHIPGLETLSVGMRMWLHEISKNAHEVLAWMGIVLIVLHVIGALRHQYLKGEAILYKMLPIPHFLNAKKASISLMILAISALSLFLSAEFLGGKQDEIVLEEAAHSKDYIDVEMSGNSEDIASDGDILEDIIANQSSVEGVEGVEGVEDISLEDAAALNNDAENAKSKSLVVKKENKSETQNSGPVKWTVSQDKMLSFTAIWNGDVLNGVFKEWDADIIFSEEALEQSSVRITINLSSVQTSNDTVNDALLGVDFFNIPAFPNAQFTSDTIKRLNEGRYEMSGQLKIKNVVKPVKVIFDLNISSNIAKVSGSSNVNRIEYGIGLNQYSEINDDVSISFTFSASR